jgi:hypothetical protein
MVGKGNERRQSKQLRVVFLLKVKGETVRDRIARRSQWQHPEGLNVVGEY